VGFNKEIAALRAAVMKGKGCLSSLLMQRQTLGMSSNLKIKETDPKFPAGPCLFFNRTRQIGLQSSSEAFQQSFRPIIPIKLDG
jgi:hypothetical protein